MGGGGEGFWGLEVGGAGERSYRWVEQEGSFLAVSGLQCEGLQRVCHTDTLGRYTNYSFLGYQRPMLAAAQNAQGLGLI